MLHISRNQEREYRSLSQTYHEPARNVNLFSSYPLSGSSIQIRTSAHHVSAARPLQHLSAAASAASLLAAQSQTNDIIYPAQGNHITCRQKHPLM
jgi:hypothetical protein